MLPMLPVKLQLQHFENVDQFWNPVQFHEPIFGKVIFWSTIQLIFDIFWFLEELPCQV